MNTFYPIKHWLLTLVIGPVVVALYEVLFSYSNSILSFLESYPLFIIFGIFFSLPVLIVYYFLFYLLISKPLSTLTIKSILNLVTIIGIVVTFILLGGSVAPDYSISYSIAVVICSWLAKIKNTESISTDTTT